MRFSTKRSVYSDMPSVLSQSAICCTATNAPGGGRTKFSTITILRFTPNRRGQGIGNTDHDLTRNNKELNSTPKLPPSPVTSPGNASKSQTTLLRKHRNAPGSHSRSVASEKSANSA
jgi:hypothetical protein